jgi:hypothetical protein
MLRKLIIASMLVASTPAFAQSPTPVDPARPGAILQAMKAEKDSATDQVAVLSADLALANQKIDKLTKDLTAAKPAPAADPEKK